MSTILVTLVAAIFAATAAAPAARPSVLPVSVPADDDSARAAALCGVLLELAVHADQTRQLADSSHIAPVAPPDAAAELDKAKDLTRRARESYDNLDFASASALMDRAVAELEKADLVAHFPELTAALVYRAAARFFAGDGNGAQAEIERLLGMDGSAQFDGKVFPPDLLQLAARLRKDIKANAKATLDVRADPPGRVYVDGIYRGISPIEVRGLAPGDHYVTVQRPGFLPAQRLAKAGPGQAVDLKLDEAPSARPYHAFLAKISLGWGELEGADAARGLGRAAGADQVFSVLVRHDGLATILKVERISVSDGHLLAEASASAASDTALVSTANALFATALASDRPRDAMGAVPVGLGGISIGTMRFGLDKPSFVLYTAAASGALILSGVIVGIVAASNASTLHQTAQTDPGVLALSSRGSSQAEGADICYSLGLVSAGAFAVLRFGWPWEWGPPSRASRARRTPKVDAPAAAPAAAPAEAPPEAAPAEPAPETAPPPAAPPPPPPADDPFSSERAAPPASARPSR